jgi:hypothetical protein
MSTLAEIIENKRAKAQNNLQPSGSQQGQQTRQTYTGPIPPAPTSSAVGKVGTNNSLPNPTSFSYSSSSSSSPPTASNFRTPDNAQQAVTTTPKYGTVATIATPPRTPSIVRPPNPTPSSKLPVANNTFIPSSGTPSNNPLISTTRTTSTSGRTSFNNTNVQSNVPEPAWVHSAAFLNDTGLVYHTLKQLFA